MYFNFSLSTQPDILKLRSRNALEQNILHYLSYTNVNGGSYTRENLHDTQIHKQCKNHFYRWTQYIRQKWRMVV